MSPQTSYWVGRLKLRAELAATGKPMFFVTSFDESARAPTCEVDPLNAEKCIFEKSHRMATDAEIDAYHEQQRQREAQCQSITDRNERRRSLTLPPGLLELLGQASQRDSQAETEPEKGKKHGNAT